MKLIFNIDYRTNWGESVYVVSDILDDAGVKLQITGNEHWSIMVDVPDDTATFEYRYQVRHENGSVKNEWGAPHLFTKGRSACLHRIFDRWQDQPLDKPYYASAFTECINRRPSLAKAAKPSKGQLMLSVAAPMVAPDQVLAVCGSSESLGAWDPRKAKVMSDSEYPVWSITVDAADIKPSTEYKFVILDRDLEVVAWEGGDNRRIAKDLHKDEASVIAGMRFINPLAPWKGAGTAIPVFALRSDEDFGVGDFIDIKKMVDWCKVRNSSRSCPSMIQR